MSIRTTPFENVTSTETCKWCSDTGWAPPVPPDGATVPCVACEAGIALTPKWREQQEQALGCPDCGCAQRGHQRCYSTEVHPKTWGDERQRRFYERRQLSQMHREGTLTPESVALALCASSIHVRKAAQYAFRMSKEERNRLYDAHDAQSENCVCMAELGTAMAALTNRGLPPKEVFDSHNNAALAKKYRLLSKQNSLFPELAAKYSQLARTYLDRVR